jgi:hypothetical protein
LRNIAANNVNTTATAGNLAITNTFNTGAVDVATAALAATAGASGIFAAAFGAFSPTVNPPSQSNLAAVIGAIGNYIAQASAINPALVNVRNTANLNARNAADTALNRATQTRDRAVIAADTAHSSNEVYSHNAVYRPYAIGTQLPLPPFHSEYRTPPLENSCVVISLQAARNLRSAFTPPGIGLPTTAPAFVPTPYNPVEAAQAARLALRPSWDQANYAGAVSFTEMPTYGFVSRLENLLDKALDSLGVVNLEGNAMFFQIGANATQGIILQLKGMHTGILGGGRGDLTTLIDVRERNGIPISEQLAIIDTAEGIVNAQRSQLGAVQNRLDFTRQSVDISSENLSAAESRIRDTDMAREMMRFTQAQVLQQAGISMLAQANQLPTAILQLLQ